jgi:hypothetical protein
MNLPAHLWHPYELFGESYAKRVEEGAARLRNSRVAFVGLARNCAVRLAQNLGHLEQLQDLCGSWSLHIESNDCTDATLDVLHDYCREKPQATFHYQILGREHYGAEFAGPRTIALAEYRDSCQRWVRACSPDADYVVVIDWDAWGGWNHHGVLNGFGWLVELPGAYGMASVSLNEWKMISMGDDGQPTLGNGWTHYDAWALRGVGQSGCFFDDYTAGLGGWKHQWLPPVGSPPVLVSSAFGGMAIYRTDAYLKGTYDGVRDCEHVPFHQSIVRATGQHLYLNPSQRMIMHWMETADAANSLNGV